MNSDEEGGVGFDDPGSNNNVGDGYNRDSNFGESNQYGNELKNDFDLGDDMKINHNDIDQDMLEQDDYFMNNPGEHEPNSNVEYIDHQSIHSNTFPTQSSFNQRQQDKFGSIRSRTSIRSIK